MTNSDTHRCPICAEPFTPDDNCATDITEGVCHFECLDGSPVVDLETGEDLPDHDMHSFRYGDEYPSAQTTKGSTDDNIFLSPNLVNGFRIFESAAMVVYAGEDWSKVRSPGRARRRRKKHRQNITAKYDPSPEFLLDARRQAIYCHPAMAAAIRAAFAAKGE